MQIRPFALSLLGFLLTEAICSADVTSFNGRLNDPANTALIGSAAWTGSNPPEASFGAIEDVANNVALYVLTIATAGNVNFQSTGFGAGGVDPYFTLFSGVGPIGVVVGSNYDQAFSTGGDFDLDIPLAIGEYTLAIGAFANMSMAENWGSGTLGDGFTGLGESFYLGDSSYRLTVTTGTPVPELSSVTTVAILLWAVLYCRRRALV